jgi:hypothetical protein
MVKPWPIFSTGKLATNEELEAFFPRLEVSIQESKTSSRSWYALCSSP